MNVVQITAKTNLKGVEVWYDLMELPSSINNLNEFLNTIKVDFPNRNVRIIQIMETELG